jgi:hypothetical protein
MLDNEGKLKVYLLFDFVKKEKNVTINNISLVSKKYSKMGSAIFVPFDLKKYCEKTEKCHFCYV